MFNRIMYATLFVKDQDKALDFYTKILGFEKRTDTVVIAERLATFSALGTV